MTIKPSDFNNTNVFMPILEYNGSATSPFTLDAGWLGPGPEGVLLELKAPQQVKVSTTDYILYGSVEATLRHNARQGLVAAFIMMSSVKDEVDWEFTTANGAVGMTNYFRLGEPVYTHGSNVTTSNFDVSDWHTYGLNWTSNQLQWTIDGQVVRTLTRAQAGSQYPQTPMQIQFSTWAGGNVTNPEGTIEWSGGPIDWNSPEYKQAGYYSQEIKQFNVQCAPISSLDLANVAGNNTGSVTSFVYTGANSSTSGPVFGTSTAPLTILSDPGADGYPGYPGYGISAATSHSGSILKSKAFKYGLPIAGAVVGIALLWALVAFVRRRHHGKAPAITGIGVTGVNDDRFSGPSNVGASGKKDLAYQETDQVSRLYRNEPNMNMMMGGGIMSDAGLSHLQRQTTAGSKVSHSSNARSNAGSASYLTGASAYQNHAYEQAAQEEEEEEEYVDAHTRSYGAGNNYYNTPVSSPFKSNAQAARGYYQPAAAGDNSFEAIPMQSQQRRVLPSTPYMPTNQYQYAPTTQYTPTAQYTPNYAYSPAAAPRPSGRMYDTPNVNYYPTPVMPQGGGYMPNTPMAYGAAPHGHAPQPGTTYYQTNYGSNPQPRR